MGRALARTRLDRGDTVIVVGRDAAKAAALPGAEFIAADLSLVGENLRVLERINTRHPAVDALVLCARYFRSDRFVTAEGVEGTFALEYLSRFLLSHGLGEPGVIVNVSGPGVPMGRLHWDDLMLEHGYDGVAAQMQAGRANDLLGVAYAARHAGTRTRYVLINPGPVATSFAGQYDAATAAHVAALKRSGRPVRDGVKPIAARIDAPPAASTTSPAACCTDWRTDPVTSRWTAAFRRPRQPPRTDDPHPPAARLPRPDPPPGRPPQRRGNPAADPARQPLRQGTARHRPHPGGGTPHRGGDRARHRHRGHLRRRAPGDDPALRGSDQRPGRPRHDTRHRPGHQQLPHRHRTGRLPPVRPADRLPQPGRGRLPPRPARARAGGVPLPAHRHRCPRPGRPAGGGRLRRLPHRRGRYHARRPPPQG
ncbi:hypothetical protein HUT06_20820 [Actinomadura sp. NAK00032]|nr:hypothetical protein HUT06_20820 [Actinomadura sp. NAK00032]